MDRICLLVWSFIYLISTPVALQTYPDACTSDPLYCNGEILASLSKKFNDIKDFISFYKLNNVTREDAKAVFKFDDPSAFLNKFINCLKSSCDDVMKDWKPSDLYPNNPPFFTGDFTYNLWAKELYINWERFGYEADMSADLISSLIPVTNGFIVPGGKSVEMNYADSYWIMKGLLASEMGYTIQGMIDNFLELLQKSGFIPMGNREFLSDRTQLPMLLSMIELTNKKPSLDQLKILDREIDYFINNRQIILQKNGVLHKLFIYEPNVSGPRAEFYMADFNEKNYNNSNAASESRWDSSSRWGDAKGVNSATNIVPVDLNAIMEKNFRLMSGWYKSFDADRSQEYDQKSTLLKIAVGEFLWNEIDGIWYDYDITQEKQRSEFYISNFFPIWTKLYDQNKQEEIAKRVINYIIQIGVIRYPGGVPVSLSSNQNTWDFPNVWPTSMAYLIEGLQMLNTVPSISMARVLAQSWLQSCYKGYELHKIMFENYNALKAGEPGFNADLNSNSSVTSGVVLYLLKNFGKAVVSPNVF